MLHVTFYFKLRKQKTVHDWGRVSKAMYLNAAEDILGPETAKSLKAYHSSTTPLNVGLKTWQKILTAGYRRGKEVLYYAIHRDESTDVSNCAVLLCFVRYMGITNVKEELLWSINLPGRSTGSEIFRLLNEYFRKKKIV